jgi:hypothetical protein
VKITTSLLPYRRKDKGMEEGGLLALICSLSLFSFPLTIPYKETIGMTMLAWMMLVMSMFIQSVMKTRNRGRSSGICSRAREADHSKHRRMTSQ